MHTCIDACMYSNQGVEPDEGDWDVHKEPHSGSQVCTQLCKGVRADVGSQVDIHTCTDACSYSTQSGGLGEGNWDM